MRSRVDRVRCVLRTASLALSLIWPTGVGAAPPVGTAPAEATPEAPPLVKIPGTGVIWKICRVAGGGEDEQDN